MEMRLNPNSLKKFQSEIRMAVSCASLKIISIDAPLY